MNKALFHLPHSRGLTSSRTNSLSYRICSSYTIKFIFRFLFITIGFLNFSLSSSAALRFAAATGNWNSTATWSATEGGASGASVPTAADAVYITLGRTVTVNIANALCLSIQLGSTTGGNGAGTLLFNSGSQLTVSGVVTVGQVSPQIGTITMTSGGTLIAQSISVPTASSVWTPGTGTVQLTTTNTLPANTITSFNNLTLNTGTTTLGRSISIAGTLTQGGGNIAVGAFTLTVSGTHNAGTNTVSGAGGYTLASAATLLTAHTSGVAGNITTTTKTLNTAANYTFNGVAAQVTSATLPATVNNLTINNTANVTISASTTVSGTLTLTTGALSIGAFTVTLNGAIAITSGTLTGGATSNITFGGAGASTTLPAVTLNNLIINRTNGISLSGNVTVSGTLTLTTGALSIGAFTLTLNGAISTTSGSLTGGALSNITFGGAGASTALPAVTLNNLTINRANGISLSGNLIVGGVLTFTNGKITTGANSVYINSTGSVSRTSGHIIGNLKKYIATGATNKTFETGDAVNYTPATISFASVTTAGDLTVSVTGADHPNLSGSGIRTDKSVNRYFTLTNTGIVFTTYSLTINWVAGDVDAGAATANFKVGKYINPNWVFPTVASPLATSIQATGVNAFGDFAFGELCSLASGFSYPGSPYCPNAGTATPTLTGTSGTFTSTAGLSITAGTGAVNLAASTAGTYIVTNSVNGLGGCTSVSTSSITINPSVGTPGAITGSSLVCPGTTGQVYSISSVANATTYNWTVPAGWIITSGAGTTSITVTTGPSGDITVTAGNTCEVSAVSSLSVTTSPIQISSSAGTSNACYTTLKLAFDAINNGTHQGTITVYVNGSTTETVVAVINGSGVGSSNYSSVNIFPTASGYSINGALNSPLIDFGGADNVVIDGRVNASGSTPDLTFTNTSKATSSSTLRFINSAESNTIKYCNVSGASLATGGGMIFFSSAASGNGNINNTIDNCILKGIDDTTRPVSIIYSSGTALRPNISNVISNNKIVDFLTTATSSYGLNLRTATSDWTISGNSFYQTTPLNPTAATTYRAIYINNTSGNNFNISDNYIGGSSPLCGGTAWTMGSAGSVSYSLYLIELNVGNLVNSSIQNNVIKNFDVTSINTTPWQGIRVTNGNVNIGTVTGNIIGATTGNNSITITNITSSSTSYGIYINSNDTINVINNKIGSVTTAGSTVSHDFIGIAKTATATVNITNNIIGSLTTSNSIQAITPATVGGQNVIGISCVALGTVTVSGNTIANMYNAYLPASGTTGQIVGIDISGGGTYTVQNNIVRDLSTTSPNTTATSNASIIGISDASTGAGKIVTGNTIYNLSNTTPSAAISIIGLYYSGSISGTNVVSNNFVHSLSLTSSSTLADMYGIKIGGGATTYSNNIISIGSGITTGYPIFAIYETGGASNNNNLYFNSIYIGGTTSGASGLTYALYSNTNTNARDIRNNILYNARSTPGATNTHFAIRVAGTTSLTIDFNNFFANGTGGTICRLGTTNYATISAWQTALAAIGGGINGLNIDPLFASAGGSSASNYYASEILTGVDGTGITTDYFGIITRLNPPKMGALDCSFNPTVTSTTPASLCGTGTVTLTATASAGATIYWYDAATGGNLLGTGTSFTTPSIAVTTTFYAAAIYPSCRSSFRSGVTVTVSAAGVWTGAISTNWQTAGNWQCGGVPTSSVDVSISSGLSLYPVISSGIATANDITLQSGATLTITTTLQIAGNINNSGTITTTAGTIEMNGTASQTIPASAFATNTISNLIVNNTSGVTLAGALSLTGALTVSSGSLTTGGFLKLKSSATGTARIAQITSVAATPVNGDVTVERYIPGRRKYRIITSSVTTSASSTLSAGQEGLSIWGNWQAGGNNVSGVGNIITGGSGADGFDQQTGTPSMYTYDDVNRNYVAFSSANGKNTKYTPLKAGIPYYMFVYGDRENSIITSTPNNTTLSSTGTLLFGNQTYNSGSAIPLSNVTGRYTMLGNPFASPIDWGSVVKTNIAATYWGWDPNLSSTGGYVTVTTNGTATLISPYSGTTGLNQYIQPGQGFFVQTTAGSPQLVIREQDKVSNFNASAFRTRGANDLPLIAVNLLYDNAGSKVLGDGVLSAFDTTFSNNVGKEDAIKMTNAAENISITNGSELLSIDARQLPQLKDTMFLNILRLKKPKYTLQIFAQLMDGHHVGPYLEDTYLGTTVELSVTDTNQVEFNVDVAKAASFDPKRFRIVYRQREVPPITYLSITATPKDEHAVIDWRVKEDNTVEKYSIEHSIDNISFSKKAETVAKANNNIEVYKWTDLNVSAGINYYRIRSLHTGGKTFLSKTVSVKFDRQIGGIKIFPNPVRNQNINVQLNNVGKGQYSIAVINAIGHVAFVKMHDHPGGPSLTLNFVTNKLSPGVYHLRVSNGKENYTQSILVD